SSFEPLYELDPEIEITLRKLRKARNIVVSNSSKFVSSFDNSSPILNTSDFVEYIFKLEPAQLYELKSGFIHMLPKFHGLVGEDPHKHLKEFHVIYSIMRPQGILEDYIKMKAFPFSLDGAAKDLLYL
ncbi:hypothetical protein CR513_35983, partial [Mucuna pruriens]